MNIECRKWELKMPFSNMYRRKGDEKKSNYGFNDELAFSSAHQGDREHHMKKSSHA